MSKVLRFCLSYFYPNVSYVFLMVNRLNTFDKGVCGSIGRALGCGSRGCEFKSRQIPY